jgi:hypothetical protein
MLLFKSKKNVFVYFLAGYSVLATLLLKSLILYFLRDVWIGTQRATVASRFATNLATHPPDQASHLPDLATHLNNSSDLLPNLATHLPIK